jgi:NAD(P)-dependent dehydrogenase (short-subunit alcohol dehydrogenase family)
VSDAWTTADLPDLDGRRVLVTGATSGVGAAVVRALAARGAAVLMAGRDENRLDAAVAAIRAAGGRVEPLLVDLADQSSVRRAAGRLAEGPLHLLVCNAGVMATPYARTVDGFERQMATNFFGHFALTGLLLPQLVAGSARVVSVSSQVHRLARAAPLQDPRMQDGRYHRWRSYGQSKLANLMFAFELDRRAHAAGLPLTSVAAHPGFAATGLMASGQRSRAGGSILDAAFGMVGQPPSQGALPLLMAATADLPGGTYVGPSGPGEARGAPGLVGASRLARDQGAARRLWRLAEDATGVAYP